MRGGPAGLFNVCADKCAGQASWMRKPGSPPSRFWGRIEEALGAQGLPTTQIGVGRLLDKTQSTTAGWYHGDTVPREIDTYRRLALKGKVCVDWLITGRLPKYPISADPALNRIMETCIGLDRAGMEAVLQVARREKAQKELEKR